MEEVKPQLSQQLQQQNVKKHLDDAEGQAYQIEIRRRVRSRRVCTRVFSNKLMGVAASRSPD